MKKFLVLTTVAALGLTGSVSFTSQAASIAEYKGNAVSDGCIVIEGLGSDPSEIEEAVNRALEEIKSNNLAGCKVITIPIICNPGAALPDDSNAGADSNKPGTDEDNTGADSNKPGTDEDNTGADNNKPGTDEDNAGTDNNKPGTDEDNAGTDNNKPGADEDNAGADNSKPGADGSNTDTENNKPGTDNDNVDTTESSFAEQVVALVNKERVKAGLNPVVLDKNIEAAALIRAKEIEDLFSHTRPDGSSFSSVLKEQGIQYNGSGENIAWGQRTPEQVMNAWMNSSGHRANILNPKYTRIGVGYYQNEAGRNFWTQLFVY